MRTIGAPVARAGLCLAIGLAVSAQAFAPSSLVGVWAYEDHACRAGGGFMDLAASGAYYSDCYEGTWSVEGSEIRVVSQPVVGEMCFETGSPPVTSTGTIVEVTPQTLTIHWHVTGITIRHTRCR